MPSFRIAEDAFMKNYPFEECRVCGSEGMLHKWSVKINVGTSQKMIRTIYLCNSDGKRIKLDVRNKKMGELTRIVKMEGCAEIGKTSKHCAIL